MCRARADGIFAPPLDGQTVGEAPTWPCRSIHCINSPIGTRPKQPIDGRCICTRGCCTAAIIHRWERRGGERPLLVMRLGCCWIDEIASSWHKKSVIYLTGFLIANLGVTDFLYYRVCNPSGSWQLLVFTVLVRMTLSYDGASPLTYRFTACVRNNP